MLRQRSGHLGGECRCERGQGYRCSGGLQIDRVGTLTWTWLRLAFLWLALGGMGLPRAAAAEDWTELICAYSWPCGEALAVMGCESRGDPLAYAAGNHGLFQIAYRWHAHRVGDVAQLYDPSINVRVAWEIWSEQGWTPWRACGP